MEPAVNAGRECKRGEYQRTGAECFTPGLSSCHRTSRATKPNCASTKSDQGVSLDDGSRAASDSTGKRNLASHTARTDSQLLTYQ